MAYLSGAPPSLPSELRAHVGAFREKMRRAVAHGAVGSIVLRPPQQDAILPWARSVISIRFPSMRWLGPDSLPSDTFGEIRGGAALSTAASQRVFQHASKSWEQVLIDAAGSKPQSFDLPITAKIQVVSRHRETASSNVVAVLPGSDASLKGEYVVYSAHTDHLGIGPTINGDSIYNGAADDASGVAALLVLAQAFKSLPHPPGRFSSSPPPPKRRDSLAPTISRSSPQSREKVSSPTSTWTALRSSTHSTKWWRSADLAAH